MVKIQEGDNLKEDKLKPCPFCGAEAYLADTWDTTKYVQCTVCGCRTIHLKNKLDVIEIWNRRDAPETHPRKKKQEDAPK
ncbi:MAG: restriction alleviation protein, Lar family [Ruminococcus sp.]|nr:restriction alleviation protein, Lar family [Ruminococcus sp.]